MKPGLHLKSAILIAAATALLFQACAPLKEFGNSPSYESANKFHYPLPVYDSSKKTVIIVANNEGTELFDMMAPYYLFNATEKANVYIVAKNRFPIVVKKGLFVLPQSTFTEIDSLGINPDVIVIPFLSVIDSTHQDPVIVNWIKSHYLENTTILSICDGAATAAATGLFDGKQITAHASDYNGIKKSFSKPLWIQNTSVAGSNNLYSSAGVSNASEGSLTVINKLFGTETMRKVIENISYPYEVPKTDHQSNTFEFADKVTVGKKIIFRNDKRVGILLQDGINEFNLAGVMDTYNRTFPESIESFSVGNAAVKTKYGLTIIPTGAYDKTRIDELHIIGTSLSTSNLNCFRSAEVVKYEGPQNRYIIDECLSRIEVQYGEKYKNMVKLMLDYN